VPPPPSQAILPGGSFQTALAHASTENGSKPQSTSDTAKSSARATAEDSSADGVDTKSASLAEPEGGKVADPGTGHAQTTSDATEADASGGAGSASAGGPTGVTVSAAVESASVAYFRQAMVGSLATGAVTTGAGSASSSINAADVPAANTATGGRSTRPDRAKGQAESKNAVAAVAIPAVGDLVRLAAVNLVSLPGTGHGQESGASENSVKTAASENSAATHGKTAAAIDGAGVGDEGAASLPGGAAGDQQGSLVQAPGASFESAMDLSMVSGVSANSELTSAPVSSRATDGVSSTKSVTTGLADASWHAANDSQSGQSPQADASKTGSEIVFSKAVENGAAQATLQTVLTPIGSHENATAQSATAGSPDSAHAGKAQDLPAAAHLMAGEGTPASGINSAKLIQTMGETEMHVGMHSAEFGDISIRTSLSQLQMVTHISLDHNDLSQMISSHLSTMQTKLGEEYGLHASIEVNSQGAPFSGGQGDSPQREQQSPGRSGSGGGVGPAELSESVSSVAGLPSAGSGHGLDITV
jgi:hypothetical protein